LLGLGVLVGLVVAHGAAGSGAKHGVVPGDMTCYATNRGAACAACGVSGRRRERQDRQ
jgi:hypothetical protein